MATRPTPPPGAPEPGRDGSDASLGQLLSRLSDDLSRLLRQEVELAKSEVRLEAKKAAKAGGMLGAGALAAYLALLLVSFAAAWGLAELMPAGLGFLIVGIVYAIVAAVLLTAGRSRMQDVEPVPQQTVETVKEDARWAKDRTS